MQINWFEVFAQILNFFILLFLLNKFLFKPVMAAMERREEEISKTIKNAEAKFSEADVLVHDYEKKLSEIKNQEEIILTQAKKDAEEKREILLNQYKEEVLLKKQNFENDFNNEKADFVKEFRKFLAGYTLKISKKVLEPLSATDLEDKVFQGLIKNLENIDPEILKEERKVEKGNIIVESSGEISKTQKEELEEKILKAVNSEKSKYAIEFNKNPDLIYGYKIIFNTFTINENLNFYLKDLEEEVIKQQKF